MRKRGTEREKKRGKEGERDKRRRKREAQLKHIRYKETGGREGELER